MVPTIPPVRCLVDRLLVQQARFVVVVVRIRYRVKQSTPKHTTTTAQGGGGANGSLGLSIAMANRIRDYYYLSSILVSSTPHSDPGGAITGP